MTRTHRESALAQLLPDEEIGRYFCRAPYPSICYASATLRRGDDLKCEGHASEAGWRKSEEGRRHAV